MGFVPAVLNRDVIDEIVQVSNEEAFAMARHVGGRKALAGISSGAAIHAAVKVAQRPELCGKLIVVIVPSNGERYLSTALCGGLEIRILIVAETGICTDGVRCRGKIRANPEIGVSCVNCI